MAAWPDVDELKALLDVTGNDFDDHLTDLLEAGIAFVKSDVGLWDDDEDTPDEALKNASLRASVLMRPNGPETFSPGKNTTSGIKADERYAALMYGHRRRFGIA